MRMRRAIRCRGMRHWWSRLADSRPLRRSAAFTGLDSCRFTYPALTRWDNEFCPSGAGLPRARIRRVPAQIDAFSALGLMAHANHSQSACCCHSPCANTLESAGCRFALREQLLNQIVVAVYGLLWGNYDGGGYSVAGFEVQ